MVMMAEKRFELIYAPEVRQHLQAIEKRHHSLIRRTIEEQLQDEPDRETRNRKPLRRPAAFGATWEIRFGPGNRYRVYYEIQIDRAEVWVLAIGKKERDRLWIGGEEIEL
jgi:mRNA-degrading endonuclease RelE of RelBE toxin-antitoxin system